MSSLPHNPSGMTAADVASIPIPNEDWLKDELIPFLRQAFSWASDMTADYDFKPHIAIAIRDWQRPIDDPRVPGRTIPDQDYNFHGILLAINNRHLDRYQVHASFIDDIDAVTRYLVRRYFLKGEYKLQGLSNVASEEYLREYEARVQNWQGVAATQDQPQGHEYGDPTTVDSRSAHPFFRTLTTEERQLHAEQRAQEAYERAVSAAGSGLAPPAPTAQPSSSLTLGHGGRGGHAGVNSGSRLDLLRAATTGSKKPPGAL